MNHWLKFLLGPLFFGFCFVPPDEGGGGGTPPAGDPPPKDPPKGGTGTPPPQDLSEENARLKAELEVLRKRAAGASGGTPPGDDPDLGEKARRERERADQDKGRTKRLEDALRFQMQSKDFLKQNEALLPKEVADIFSQADKENYSDAVEKDAAIKAGIVQSFFSVQANVDLLTPGLKAQLDEYLKLTKSGKQEKAQHFYDTVFEPAFEMLKRVKRAEALSKGYGGGSDAEAAYKNKMMKLSRRHYLGEKNGS